MLIGNNKNKLKCMLGGIYKPPSVHDKFPNEFLGKPRWWVEWVGAHMGVLEVGFSAAQSPASGGE